MVALTVNYNYSGKNVFWHRIGFVNPLATIPKGVSNCRVVQGNFDIETSIH